MGPTALEVVAGFVGVLSVWLVARDEWTRPGRLRWFFFAVACACLFLFGVLVGLWLCALRARA